METEKIISEVLGKVGNTDVSKQTVETIINLNPLQEGTEPDDAYFEKMAGVVKSFQGNINHVFSEKLTAQVNQKVDEFKKSYKPEKQEPTPNNDNEDLKSIKEQLKQLQAARNEDLAKARRSTISSQVKEGLREKFKTSGMDVKDFFIDTAIGKISIPDKDEDISALVTEAEKHVIRDMKAAGIDTDAPSVSPRGGGNGKGWLDKKFAEKAVREGYAKKS